jgi:CheY-like chemotaxis protein
LDTKIPAVAVTAFARPVDRVRALQAGYNMHVAKPLEPHEIIKVVAALVGAARRDKSHCRHFPCRCFA